MKPTNFSKTLLLLITGMGILYTLSQLTTNFSRTVTKEVHDTVYVKVIPITTGITGENRLSNENIIIGNSYTLHTPPNDPFDVPHVAKVRIIHIKAGWVQYCWDHEYNDPDKLLFTLTVEDFVSYLK